MDFGSLLHIAQKNSRSDVKPENKFYQTKFEPPKKEAKERKLSANIQKFLAKKDDDERRQAQMARQKREELLAMRDVKAKNKISKMLKVIKSANKSVLSDAIDNENTAVTLAGPDQPDEDDYGYVSQEASAFYRQMMDKYKKTPDSKRSTPGSRAGTKAELNTTKDRVRAAINRAHDEESIPQPRKRTHKPHGELWDPVEEQKIEERSKPTPPKRQSAPPPPALDFQQLLKLAEQKQFEPVHVETKRDVKREPERLMTKKEKREYEEHRLFQEARENRLKKRDEIVPPKATRPAESAAATGQAQKMAPNGRIPKLNGGNAGPPARVMPNERLKPVAPIAPIAPVAGASKHVLSERKSRPDVAPSKAPPPSRPAQSNSRPLPSKTYPREAPPPSNPNLGKAGARPAPPTKAAGPILKERLIASEQRSRPVTSEKAERNDRPALAASKLNGARQEQASRSNSDRSSQAGKVKQAPGPNESRARQQLPADVKTRQLPAADVKTRQFPPADVKTRQFPPADVKTRQFPPADVKTRQFPPADVKTRQFPPADTRPRQFPPKDVRGGRQFPPKDVKRKQAMKRRTIHDDDSEYDSEMDDFIDDGPETGNEYSKYIQEIFGYDKGKYRDEDFDDRQMETNFAQQQREEYVSRKIGIMEDLEDMRMEAMEKSKKDKKKKRRIDDDDDDDGDD